MVLKMGSTECCPKICQGVIGTDGFLNCKCGQEFNRFEWKFTLDNNIYNSVLLNENKDILFHPEYSTGTALVRGEKPFSKNRLYFWEVKILTPLYGTDVMIGVGTSAISLKNWDRQYCSALGLDPECWGYSFNGKLQHNHQTREYGVRWGLGSLVGVFLDTYKGTLEYYINRKPIGLAFTDLKNFELYPMVSCTMATTGLRLTCSVSELSSLQIECLKVIMKNPDLYRQYKEELYCLAKVYEVKYFWIQPSEDIQAEASGIKKKKRDDISFDDIFGDNLKKTKTSTFGHFIGKDGVVLDLL